MMLDSKASDLDKEERPEVHTSKRACASVYPSTVQNGILWVWPNSDPKYRDILSVQKPPYISELDDPLFTKPLVNRDFPFGYEILTENLIDPCHVPYAHFKLLPNLAPIDSYELCLTRISLMKLHCVS
ncbi:Protochlorophyllide-dependent translocon component 52, chloroplastic [Linum perenne]